MAARAGSTLVGAHLTIGDRGRVPQIAIRIRAACQSNPNELFVVGPSLNTWELSPLKNHGFSIVRVLDTNGFGHLDLCVRLENGVVRFGLQPNTTNQGVPAGDNFQAIDSAAFHTA